MKYPPLLSRIYMPGAKYEEDDVGEALRMEMKATMVQVSFHFHFHFLPFPSAFFSSAIKALAITHNGLIKKLSLESLFNVGGEYRANFLSFHIVDNRYVHTINNIFTSNICKTLLVFNWSCIYFCYR